MKKFCMGLLAIAVLAGASFVVMAATDFFYPKGAFKVRWDRDDEDSFSLKAWTADEYESTKDPDWIGAYVEITLGGESGGGYIDETGKLKADWGLVKLIKGGGGL
ncbi:MAG: hypothetical protein N3A38_12945, partial [Planctomycetota bacterium]|nr:hypothetical protein [Planctomycetota bacterium]